jgi:cytochrome P450
MAQPKLPPGPRAWNLPAAMVDAKRFLPGLFQHLAGRYGDVACLRVGPVKVILASSPAAAHEVLVEHEGWFEKGRGERRFTRRLLGNGVLGSEGPFHDHQHDLLVPVTHGAAIDPYARVVVDRGTRMVEAWRPGQIVDVFDLLTATTMDAMVETLCGAAVESAEGGEFRAALDQAVAALERLPLPILSWAERLPLPSNRRFAWARDRLDGILLAKIAQRREHSDDHADLLAALVRARREDGTQMDDREVRDEALSIFRGHKTTGTALCWSWYLLSQDPDAEARVLQEIDAVVGDRAPVAEDVARLTFCRRVVDEALRLYPSAWMMARRSLQEQELEGYRIPAGATVITSPYVIQRDARFHPDPDRFDPDRFAPERRAGWHPFAYFPFGGGHKRCLGDEFAPFEALLLMAVVGRRWRLRVAPGHRVEPAPKATLKMKHGLKVVLEAR